MFVNSGWCDNNRCLTIFDRRKRTMRTFHPDGLSIPILSLKNQKIHENLRKTDVSSVRLDSARWNILSRRRAFG